MKIMNLENKARYERIPWIMLQLFSGFVYSIVLRSSLQSTRRKVIDNLQAKISFLLIFHDP